MNQPGEPTCKWELSLTIHPNTSHGYKDYGGQSLQNAQFCAEQPVGTHCVPPYNAQHTRHPLGNIPAEGQKIKWAHAFIGPLPSAISRTARGTWVNHVCSRASGRWSGGEMGSLRTANCSRVLLQHNENLPTPQAVSPGAGQTLTLRKYEFELEP